MTTWNARSVFGPSEISRLTAAYDAALKSVAQQEGSGSGLTARELKRQVAAGIMAAARNGQLDGEHLKEAALNSLKLPFAELDDD